MTCHSTPVKTPLRPGPEPRVELLRPAVISARAHVAHLIALGFIRVPVHLVASRAGVAVSTAHLWRSAEHPGPRLSDMVCAGGPFAEAVLRGALGLLPRSAPLAPRTALGLLLSDLGALLAEADEPPEKLSDEQVLSKAQRARSAEKTAGELAMTYEAELRRRGLPAPAGQKEVR